MIKKELTVTNSLGLHARPATYFVQKATSFKCSINLLKEDRSVNAKSLLGVLSMGVTKGGEVALVFDGIDEDEAAETICGFISSGCGEVAGI